MSRRKQNFQSISWFHDLYQRDLLILDPPFQRRSVWNQAYREQFIETILLNYPAPAIFLFPETDEHGKTRYSVVDGKQRLTAIFDFIANEYPVAENSELVHRGLYFEKLPKEVRVAFFEYDFSVEYLPTNNEVVIGNIFDRLNRNVAKLTPQELRHARFDGVFIKEAESLAEWMTEQLGPKFPRIPENSRRQMKDVEMVATLLLLLEEGAKSYAVQDIDAAFSDRDKEWDSKTTVVDEFRQVMSHIKNLTVTPESSQIVTTRFRNQIDFYSLFGAYAELIRERRLPAENKDIYERLSTFLTSLEDENERASKKEIGAYWDASRSSTNDEGPRKTRIRVIKKVIMNESLETSQ